MSNHLSLLIQILALEDVLESKFQILFLIQDHLFQQEVNLEFCQFLGFLLGRQRATALEKGENTLSFNVNLLCN